MPLVVYRPPATNAIAPRARAPAAAADSPSAHERRETTGALATADVAVSPEGDEPCSERKANARSRAD